MKNRDRLEEICTHLRPYVSERRRARIEEALRARTRDIVVVLEDIFSDHNTSAVFRTAEATGLVEIHIVVQNAPFRISRKITQGAHKWLEVTREPDIESTYAALRARGYQVWASAVHGDAKDVQDLPTDVPVALVFGNEHEGLSEAALNLADGCFRVPMRGFVESLNISVAAAISMFTAYSERKRAGTLRGLGSEDMKRMRARWYYRSVRAAEQLLSREGISARDLEIPSLPASDDVVE